MKSVDIHEAELVLDARAELGEGPVWDADARELVWVDIMAGLVHRFRLSDGATSTITVGQPVGAAALRERGGLVLAVQEGFATVDRDAAEIRLVAPVEADVPENRMNDGKCDPAGRFWAGTMAIEEGPPVGGLYRLDPDLTVTRVLTGVSISNGLGWSPDGRTMYYVDTPTSRIDVFDFDVAAGTLAERRPFVELDPSEGYPDGLTVDEEGFVWLALWGGSAVRRYAPDGSLAALVPLPVNLVTSCAFGGEDLGDLYITSAWRGRSAEQRAAEPFAGGIFRCRPGVRGLPAACFGG